MVNSGIQMNNYRKAAVSVFTVVNSCEINKQVKVSSSLRCKRTSLMEMNAIKSKAIFVMPLGD